MMTADEILAKFNDYLDHLPYNRKPQSLYEPVKYVLSLGGKRIRPTLMMLAYNLYKDDPESILSSACALETYHNYTLLHDDLMDNADLRRGQMTVHRRWNANTAILSGDSMLVLAYQQMTVHRRWNANTAILSGDSMLVLAYQRMQQCPSDKLADVLKLFTETALEIGEGQQYDMEFEHRNDVTEAEYIEMIRLKTSVLLACALKMGALLADAPESDCENLYHFGELTGLAFQLQDDFLDVYGDTKVFGKAIGGDILAGKKTFMLINALAKANSSQRQQLEQWLVTTDRPQEKIEAVTQLYNEIGVDAMATEKISYYFNESYRYLEAVNVDEKRKQELKLFTERMMKRQY